MKETPINQPITTPILGTCTVAIFASTAEGEPLQGILIQDGLPMERAMDLCEESWRELAGRECIYVVDDQGRKVFYAARPMEITLPEDPRIRTARIGLLTKKREEYRRRPDAQVPRSSTWFKLALTERIIALGGVNTTKLRDELMPDYARVRVYYAAVFEEACAVVNDNVKTGGEFTERQGGETIIAS